MAGSKAGRVVALVAATLLLVAVRTAQAGDALSPPSIDTSMGDPNAASADAFKCEVCMVVIERRESRLSLTPCQGLEYYSTVCAEVTASMLHWSNWIRYWQEDKGCHKVTPVGLAMANPCPAHVICSWMTSFETRKPFCPADHTYHSPQDLSASNDVE